jgi:hypothetical protein
VRGSEEGRDEEEEEEKRREKNTKKVNVKHTYSKNQTTHTDVCAQIGQEGCTLSLEANHAFHDHLRFPKGGLQKEHSCIHEYSIPTYSLHITLHLLSDTEYTYVCTYACAQKSLLACTILCLQKPLLEECVHKYSTPYLLYILLQKPLLEECRPLQQHCDRALVTVCVAVQYMLP